MITYAQLAHTPRLLQNFTGLSAAAFARLLTAFVTAYTAAGRSSDAQRTTPRQRQPGGGRHATLQTPADKLLFILLYFRFYPTQELVGFLFGISQPQANVWVHRLTPVLNAALGQEQQLSLIHI